MKKIMYVTGNRLKIESAKHALEPLGFEAYTYGAIAQSKSPSQAENWDYVFIPN